MTLDKVFKQQFKLPIPFIIIEKHYIFITTILVITFIYFLHESKINIFHGYILDSIEVGKSV